MQQRDYVHIEDVVRANLLALDNDRMNFEAYNVGTGKSTTVLEYAQKLGRQMGVELEAVLPGAYRVGDVRHTVSSIGKITQLGWKPAKDLDDIFKHYLSWLGTLTDTEDYFTPAYAAMKQEGVVRMVQPERDVMPLMAANF